MNSRFSQQLIWLGVTVLILTLSPGQAVSEEMRGLRLTDDLVIRWDAESPFTELKSGEVEVRTSTVFLGRRGSSYNVSLSFQNKADYDAALAAGAEGFKLSDLESLWTMRTQDKLEQVARPRAKTVLDLISRAASPVCGKAAARGVARLQGDIFVGVSLLAAPMTKVDDFAHDIHGACDFFAAGGCGSGTCYNSWLKDIGVGSGYCQELEVWGPNTCYCHTTAILR